MKRAKPVGLLIAALALVASEGSSRLIRVPFDVPMLQDACQQACSGDTVGVYAGTYVAEFAAIRPGVTVRGMEVDSTRVRVLPGDPWGSLFDVWPGDEAAVLENMELHGADCYGGSVLCNGNPNMLVQHCYLRVVIDTGECPSVVGAYADLTVRECDIVCHLAWFTSLVGTFNAARVIVEDCVIETHDNYIGDIHDGSVIELRNNTFVTHPWRFDVDPYVTDFAIFFVNNVFEEGAVCFPDAPLPDVVEWRYNDFVRYQPAPGCGYQVGNFSEDPLFCDAAQWDFRLQPESPCIGAGENGEDVGARRGICWPASEAGSGLEPWAGPLRVSRVQPNPAAGAVTITLAGTSVGSARAEIIDPAGRVVRKLAEDPSTDGGLLRWDGCGTNGRRVPSGVYYLRLLGGVAGRTTAILIVR